MKIIKTVQEMQEFSANMKRSNKKIGFVPTMGFLHEGHLSLIKFADEKCDIVITSIFVNPTQFAPNEDFESYPRDFERDERLAAKAGCEVIFYPSVREMYPKNYQTTVSLSKVTQKFEGERRPSHFNGVATVVSKLFNAVRPDMAVFGQKDFQQTLVIKKMNEDLNFGIDVVIAPTIRESNGLAMSSRNTYLSEEHREKAGIIFVGIEETRNAIDQGENERKVLNAILQRVLRSVPEIRIDYAAVVDADTMEEPEYYLPGEKVAIIVACYLGKTRLIDNAIATIPSRLNEDNFKEGI